MLDMNLKGQDILVVQYKDGRTRIMNPLPRINPKSAPFTIQTGYEADRILFVGADGSVEVLMDQKGQRGMFLEALSP